MTAGHWADLGLPRVVNAAGKMTYLGSATLSPGVVAAMSAAAVEPVEMARLKHAAGARIAELIGAESAQVVSSAASGIALAVAAVVVGRDLSAIESVPVPGTTRRRVLLQNAHAVHFGAPITQMVRLGGGLPVEVGSANRCTPAHLAEAIDADTAAVLHVVSHHVMAESEVSLEESIAIAHAAGVPVIVDAAAETDLRGYAGSGADLVCFSGHKAIGGPTAGVVAGKSVLVASCAAQEVGIGRAMKVGKETIAGVLAAVEEYLRVPPDPEELHARLASVVEAAGDGLRARFEVVLDPTRPIPRLVIEPSDDAHLTARELGDVLEMGSPSIRTRNHEAARGRIAVDPRELTDEDAREVGRALRRLLTGEES
ncbi:putative pyridoxal phosphate-dependent enzyme [Microbacterium resistens]|uniref:Pyridoxal phosphate-dependent enzyme n=1 Tax=Microbacterium resistens TaxID=156977 RepID=A0ABU1S9E4_9MICO|nr:aminotransferase class V-fold PLP-dependent enzyme [Microbacterium resistens]MDR6866226.1 putative pyridoxal phosphate-dependent enzyme [Microbacterium resistens]